MNEKKEKEEKLSKATNERIFNQQDYQPRRFNLKFNPPIIVLEYVVPSSGKTYNHNIKLKKLEANSDIEETLKQVYEKHYVYLDSQKVKVSQVKSIKSHL